MVSCIPFAKHPLFHLESFKLSFWWIIWRALERYLFFLYQIVFSDSARRWWEKVFILGTFKVMLCNIWSLSLRDVHPPYCYCFPAVKSFLYTMNSFCGQEMGPSYSLQLSYIRLFSQQSLFSPERSVSFHTTLLLFSQVETCFLLLLILEHSSQILLFISSKC